MLQQLMIAACLVFIFEGMLPFIAPQAWRKFITEMINLTDDQLRLVGLVAMLFGLTCLYLIN